MQKQYASTELKLNRGYTGHEHLPWFGVINMNARLYDPSLGRFLSPDPYVQSPDKTQNFNRYAYCMNNPVMYTDTNGKWFFKTILTGAVDLVRTAFFKGGLDPTSSHARRKAWRNFDPTASWSPTNKAFKIDMGIFKTDSDRSFGKRVFQLVSRLTWELPQTWLGNTYSHIRNWNGEVDRVDYFGGATFLTTENSKKNRGVSIGNYININFKDEVGDDFTKTVISNPIFMHEYGHTFDSQIFGFSYLLVIGVPSLISSATQKPVSGEAPGVTTHKFRWYEMRANKHAAKYFEKYHEVDWRLNEIMYPREKR